MGNYYTRKAHPGGDSLICVNDNNNKLKPNNRFVCRSEVTIK